MESKNISALENFIKEYLNMIFIQYNEMNQRLYRFSLKKLILKRNIIYNAVEIKNWQNYILSLERYSEIYRNNALEVWLSCLYYLSYVFFLELKV